VIKRLDFLANSTLCTIVNVAVFISTKSCLFNLVRLFAGERLGKNPYACRDKARHHGFTTVNGADVSDDEDVKAISTSYLNWSKDEDDCLLAYVDHAYCVSNVTKYFLCNVADNKSLTHREPHVIHHISRVNRVFSQLCRRDGTVSVDCRLIS
jgi:hypothetical protein